jgi:hypothetical protein
VDLNYILYGGDDIEGDLDAMLFNLVASTVPKWLTFKLLSWVKLLKQLLYLGEILCGVMTLKVMSITPKWRTFKLLMWVHILN